MVNIQLRGLIDSPRPAQFVLFQIQFTVPSAKDPKMASCPGWVWAEDLGSNIPKTFEILLAEDISK